MPYTFGVVCKCTCTYYTTPIYVLGRSLEMQYFFVKKHSLTPNNPHTI